MVVPLYTGVGNTDARQLCYCPKCGAVPGEYCRMPSGRKWDTNHWQRSKVLREQHPEAIIRATGRTKNGRGQWMDEIQ